MTAGASARRCADRAAFELGYFACPGTRRSLTSQTPRHLGPSCSERLRRGQHALIAGSMDALSPSSEI